MPHPRAMPGDRNRIWLAVASVSLAAFVLIACLILATDVLDSFDRWALLSMQEIRAPTANTVMQWIAWAGSYRTAPAAALVILYLWLLRRRHEEAFRLALAVTGAPAYNLALKALLARPRPELIPALAATETVSFPSGHATFAMAFYGTLAILLWRKRHRVAPALLAVLIGLVSFSRVYLGVHYATDVIGALCLGVAWLYVVLHVRTPGADSGTEPHDEGAPSS